MSWSNYETQKFNLHHRDDVMEALTRNEKVDYEEVLEEIDNLIESIREVTNHIDGFLFDIVDASLEQINKKELAEIYYQELSV